MQLMPETAKGLSRQAGNDGFTLEDLFDPSVNIGLGSRYLSSLLARFDNDVVLAIAGYNAGPEAVSRWALSSPSEYDEFIESIPYRETRNYAKRVLRSYGEYMRLSGEDPSELFRDPRLTLIRKTQPGYRHKTLWRPRMDEKQNRARAFSAFGYAARVAVLVILTEALIMVLLGYLQVSRVASGAIDTSLLTLILIPPYARGSTAPFQGRSP